MDRIDAMRLFLRVADAGSFSKAAKDLGLGQPTVSRRIQDLEGQLEADLFLRTTRALSLTEAGERFYQRAKDILSDFDNAEAEARGLQNEAMGQLRIVSVNSLTRRVIAPQVASFIAKHPQVEFDLISDDGITDLIEERIDLAFRMGRLPDSSLMARKISEAPRGLWASPQYLAKHGHPAHPKDLSGHDFVLFRSDTQRQLSLTSRNGETANIDISGPFQASSGDVLVQAAADGLGIMNAPAWLVNDCKKDGRLERILPDWQASPLVIHCVWPSGKLRGKAKLFADHMTEALKFAPLD